MRRNVLFSMLIVVLLIGVISVLSSAAQDEPMGNEGEHRMLLEKYLEAFVTDVTLFPDLLTEDVVRHHLMGVDLETGELSEQFNREELAENATGFQTGFPGVEFTVLRSVERGNLVWAFQESSELPDGGKWQMPLLLRIEDGKIAEIWVAGDELSMLALLEVRPIAGE